MRGERSKHERSVIIQNLFSPELFDKEPATLLEFQNDLRDECNKCGTVRKVIIYDVSKIRENTIFFLFLHLLSLEKITISNFIRRDIQMV